jgi:glycosyltransferase involved in cell wall biosynthesis
MELSKDNLDNIIKAFALIQNKYQDYELCFYGKPNKTDAFKLKSLIEELQLVNKIHFKGLIPADKVPEILLTSKILVSSQPNTKRASGGFPTKLGEYLISGTPSLFTDVGENSKYVKNEIHLFFAKPNDSKDYAKKLEFIINNYDHACMIAKNGKKMVESNFSHISAGRSIKEFINYLN